MRKYRIIGKWFRGLVILYCCVCTLTSSIDGWAPKCFTGYMTKVQTWVNEQGGLKLEGDKFRDTQNAIDLSCNLNPVPILHQKITVFRASHRSVKYLSMARCKLNRVPPIFNPLDPQGKGLAETLEYLTFYGNKFTSYSVAGKQYGVTLNVTDAVEMTLTDRQQTLSTILWSSGFEGVEFLRLRELDLRACSIHVLSANVFSDMKNLEALYIGENQIYHIDAKAFDWLINLVYLDISANEGYDENGNPKTLNSAFNFNNLRKLTSLNFAYTKLTQQHIEALRGLGRRLKSLSLCETGLTNLPEGIFNKTSLQILDVSRNTGILSNGRALQGLEYSLKFFYGREIGLQTFEIFQNFIKLEILQLSNNEINLIRPQVARTLDHLRVLDLIMNRLTTWFEPTYSLIPKLQLLFLRENNINVISEEIIKDIANVSYVALGGNFIVCNCHVKDFYKMAAMNEKIHKDVVFESPKSNLYHCVFEEYKRLITMRNEVDFDCQDEYCDAIKDSGNFRLLDYSPGAYTCLLIPGSKSVPFSEVHGCSRIPREIDYDNELAEGRRKLLILLLIPCVLLPVAIMFVFRRNLRYCFIMMRNSAMIGMINNNETLNDGTIFNYDVFVSYCNEDRGWVLDHLLPHIEAECSVSACLHERDFQVSKTSQRPEL